MTPLTLIYWALATAAALLIVGFAGVTVQAMVRSVEHGEFDA